MPPGDAAEPPREVFEADRSSGRDAVTAEAVDYSPSQSPVRSRVQCEAVSDPRSMPEPNPAQPDAPRFPFENTYARLPEHFFARLAPTAVARPRLVHVNEALAHELRLDAEALRSPEGVAMLAGNRVPEGAEPLAMAYAGFQFGSWVPQLGDGRAILLGEIVGRDGVRRDVQLKGAGRTPFSRRGDGRAGIGPVLREYVVSEAMSQLGVATTRALAAVTTGEQIAREEMLPGAVLTRVARSHIRVGTFQFFAGRGDTDALRALADHAIARHDPAAAEAEQPYLALLRGVLERQAKLVAQWQLIGFIHGVMNTDNCSIAGETIDYGPCAFMDIYHPETVYSSIDHTGRYAYCNQPPIAHWNLGSFAQALLPLLGEEEESAVERAREELARFPACFGAAYDAGMRRKLGFTEARADDPVLAADLLECMATHELDFTLVFRHLCDAQDEDEASQAPSHGALRLPEAFDAWVLRWRARIATEASSAAERSRRMRAANPLFIPRNHLVEEVIVAATREGDFGPFHELVAVLERPYEHQAGRERYAAPPRAEQVVHQTFCGT